MGGIGTPLVGSSSVVSVLLLTYNSASIIEDVLDALENQSHRCVELLVQDNASEDDTANILISRGIRFIRSEVNIGYAGGMNALLSRCSGDYVIFLNADCILSPQFIESVTRILDSDPSIGVVGGFVSRPTVLGTSTPDGCRLGISLSMRVRKLDHKGVREPTFKANGSCPTITARTLRRLKAEYGVPGFEEYYDTYGEDVDFAFRLAGVGANTVVDPAVHAIHARSRSSNSERITSKRGRLRINVIAGRHMNCIRHARPVILPISALLIVVGDLALAAVQLIRRDVTVLPDIYTAYCRTAKNARWGLSFRRKHQTWRKFRLSEQVGGRF